MTGSKVERAEIVDLVNNSVNLERTNWERQKERHTHTLVIKTVGVGFGEGWRGFEVSIISVCAGYPGYAPSLFAPS